MQTANHIPSTNLAILSTSVRRDSEGRYCLNDCHRAAGGDANKAPGQWMANKQTKALIAEIETVGISTVSETAKKSVVTVEGRNGGTYAVKELVYAYAMWISPAFHLTVIRTFDAYAQRQIDELRAKVEAAQPKPKIGRGDDYLSIFPVGEPAIGEDRRFMLNGIPVRADFDGNIAIWDLYQAFQVHANLAPAAWFTHADYETAISFREKQVKRVYVRPGRCAQEVFVSPSVAFLYASWVGQPAIAQLLRAVHPKTGPINYSVPPKIGAYADLLDRLPPSGNYEAGLLRDLAGDFTVVRRYLETSALSTRTGTPKKQQRRELDILASACSAELRSLADLHYISVIIDKLNRTGDLKTSLCDSAEVIERLRGKVEAFCRDVLKVVVH